MDKKVSFKIARAKKRPNGASSITVIGQPYNGITITVDDKGLSLTGTSSHTTDSDSRKTTSKEGILK